MALPKKLKNALRSSPSTYPLIKFLENAVDNDTIYDDTEIQGKVSALETLTAFL